MMPTVLHEGITLDRERLIEFLAEVSSVSEFMFLISGDHDKSLVADFDAIIRRFLEECFGETELNEDMDVGGVHGRIYARGRRLALERLYAPDPPPDEVRHNDG